MWRMLQQNQPDDFVIATGESHSLQEFVEAAFRELKLDWQEFVVADSSLLRPTDLAISKANPSKAMSILNWQAKNKMKDVVSLMIEEEKK